jgi:hypothetical protein
MSKSNIWRVGLVGGLCLLLAGCGTPNPPLPPALELPETVSDLKAVRKGSRVMLAWTVPQRTTEGRRVGRLGATRICRSFSGVMSVCVVRERVTDFVQVTTGPAGKGGETVVTASYTDTLSVTEQAQNASGMATYAVEVLNPHERSAGLSNQVQVAAAPVLAPPEGFQATVTAGGVGLSWEEVADDLPAERVKHLYRIYRREEGKNEVAAGQVVLGEVAPGAPRQFLDTGFEWEKNFVYRLTTVSAVTRPGAAEVQVEGDDAAPVEVFAHDVFPPAAPVGVQAVFSGAGQQPFVDLTWVANSEGDLAGYNVYRWAGAAVGKINVELVKTPAFRDSAVAAGKTYLYRVTAVDARGNESARSVEAGEELP